MSRSLGMYLFKFCVRSRRSAFLSLDWLARTKEPLKLRSGEEAGRAGIKDAGVESLEYWGEF